MGQGERIAGKRIERARRWRGALYALVVLALLLGCSTGSRSDFTLVIAHTNDTHSHLEPLPVALTVDGVKTTAQLGGFARLKTVLDGMRTEYPDLLFLHGGDAVQGTLYFTLFGGVVEFDFLNLLGIDAMTFGNHEFDRGPGPIPGWIERSTFPWISANIDFSGEPAIAPSVKPYLVRRINGEEVAIIGLTTEETPQSTPDVGEAIFNDAAASARQQAEALSARGITKIILLSHLGYERDKELAATVPNIDIIVGGHSHSLLEDEGKPASIGLTAAGPYPTEMTGPDGKRVLVVQAWQWGHGVGRLTVRFTPEGEVAGYSAGVTIPLGDRFEQDNVPIPSDSPQYRRILEVLAASGTARIVPEDPAVAAKLDPYARQVAAYRSIAIAAALDAITRGLNSGPGPLAADSMLAAVPNAREALLNYGGVRKDLPAGTISVGDVLETMPFANTLVLVDMTGAELKNALEDGIEYLLRHFPGQAPPAMPYIAGAGFSVRPTAPQGSRITDLAVKGEDGAYRPVEAGTLYRIVTNSFVAGGGDGFAAVKNAAGVKIDTGIIDSDAFRDHLKGLGSVINPTEERITVLPAESASLLPLPGWTDGSGSPGVALPVTWRLAA